MRMVLSGVLAAIVAATVSGRPEAFPRWDDEATSPVPSAVATPSQSAIAASPVLALISGTLIDGTGRPPIPDAVVIVRGDRIDKVGPRGSVRIPAGATVIDMGGGTILPGFINAHVHDAFSERNLEAWAQAGVTTVRDEGIISSRPLPELLALRDRLAADPRYARLVSAGRMIAPPNGYGLLFVVSPAQAQKAVEDEIASGVDLIKFSIEDGYGRRNDLPLPEPASVAAIVAAAHKGGRLVSAHVTEAAFLKQAVDAGADDVGHMAWDPVDQDTIAKMVARQTYVTPTITVLDAYGAADGALDNLRRFDMAGVKIALGNDYTDVPQNNFRHFELGMPMHEMSRMVDAGMTPMSIIVAATKHAAHVCQLDRTLGTVEPGKLADLLVSGGDPIRDLKALTAVRLVVHAGVVIRDSRH